MKSEPEMRTNEPFMSLHALFTFMNCGSCLYTTIEGGVHLDTFYTQKTVEIFIQLTIAGIMSTVVWKAS